jgi:hypothetical protein
MNERVGRILRQGWIVSVVGYSVVRFVAAWGALGQYGVNPIVFGVIDVATAYPYAHATTQVVQNAWQGRARSATVWGAVALVMFVSPYAYILAAGGAMPPSVRTAVVAVTLAMAAVVVVGLVRRTRRGVHAIAA